MKKIALVTLVSLPILMTNCQVKETASDNQEVSVKVKTMRVDSSEDQRVNKYSGTVEEASETALSFPVAGTIQEMRVRLGDRVTKGQLIATIDPSTMGNSHAVAKAALSNGTMSALAVSRSCSHSGRPVAMPSRLARSDQNVASCHVTLSASARKARAAFECFVLIVLLIIFQLRERTLSACPACGLCPPCA